MNRDELHGDLADRLRDDPDDLTAIAILADWLEEQGADIEAAWLQDNLHGLSPLMRSGRAADAPQLLRGIDPLWLHMRHGLIRALLVPTRQPLAAERTCSTLAELPLALGLWSAVLKDEDSATAWLPPLARFIPELRSLHLPADVDPAHLAEFRQLRMLRVVALPRLWPSMAVLPALRSLTVEAVGRSLNLLDALEPAGVEHLTLSAGSWYHTPHRELMGFLGRVPVDVLEVRGSGDGDLAQDLRAAGWHLEDDEDDGLDVRLWRPTAAET